MNIHVLLALITKNLKLLMRSKMSALIVIFGPLLLLLLLSVAFHSANVYGVRVGVYSQSYSPLTLSLMKGLEEQSMTVSRADSQEACIQGLRLGVYNVCAVFPSDYSVERSGEVVFYVDPSRYNLVYFVVERLTALVSEQSKTISTQLTKGVVDVLAEANTKLEDRKALLGELSTTVNTLDLRLADASSQLSVLNLSYPVGTIPFSTLESQVSELKNAAQITTDVDATIASIEANVDEILLLLGETDTARYNALRTLEDASALVTGEAGIILSFEGTLQDVLHDLQQVRLKDVSTLVSPLRARVEPVLGSGDVGGVTINYLFPTLVVILLMFSGMLLAATLEVREKTDKVHFKNFIAPPSQMSFLLGNFLANFFVVLVQAGVLFFAGFFFFASALLGVWVDVMIILALLGATFVLLGMFLGSLFHNEETVLIASVSVGFIFLFLSGAVVPSEVLPASFKWVSAYNPFALGDFLLNKTLLFHTGLNVAEMKFAVLLLCGWVAGLAVLTFISRKLIVKAL